MSDLQKQLAEALESEGIEATRMQIAWYCSDCSQIWSWDEVRHAEDDKQWCLSCEHGRAHMSDEKRPVVLQISTLTKKLEEWLGDTANKTFLWADVIIDRIRASGSGMSQRELVSHTVFLMGRKLDRADIALAAYRAVKEQP